MLHCRSSVFFSGEGQTVIAHFHITGNSQQTSCRAFHSSSHALSDSNLALTLCHLLMSHVASWVVVSLLSCRITHSPHNKQGTIFYLCLIHFHIFYNLLLSLVSSTSSLRWMGTSTLTSSTPKAISKLLQLVSYRWFVIYCRKSSSPYSLKYDSILSSFHNRSSTHPSPIWSLYICFAFSSLFLHTFLTSDVIYRRL